MKHFILIALTFIVTASQAHALFGRTASEKERRQAVEQHLVQEQQANGQLIHTNQHLQVVIHVLSAGVVISLMFGAAVGSKTRRDARQS
jgi:lipid-binding SYLF domain-containing protein